MSMKIKAKIYLSDQSKLKGYVPFTFLSNKENQKAK
jgi:hypothetical protein